MMLLELREFTDHEWNKIGEINIQNYQYSNDFAATFHNDLLHIFFTGRSLRWKTFDGEVWKDLSKHAPGSNYVGRCLGWMLLICLPLSFPALLVIPANIHFKMQKEHVVEVGGKEIEIATLGRRFMAFAIDQAIVYVPFFLASYLLATYLLIPIDAIYEDEGKMITMWAMIAAFAVLFVLLGPIYFTILERNEGRTIGKRLMGIRVVRADGADFSLKRSLIPNLLRIPDLLLYFIPAIVFMAATSNMQRLGDFVVGTVVVRE